MLALRRVLGPSTLRAPARNRSAYEGSGKTTVSILNKDPDSGVLIDAFSNRGFKFNNGIRAMGPIILFARTILAWKISTPSEVNAESLVLFSHIEPKVDVLVLGMGNPGFKPVPHDELKSILRRGTTVEVLSTEKAIGSFNYLNAEGRNVAAALVPPYSFIASEDDFYRASEEGGFLDGDRVIQHSDRE